MPVAGLNGLRGAAPADAVHRPHLEDVSDPLVRPVTVWRGIVEPDGNPVAPAIDPVLVIRDRRAAVVFGASTSGSPSHLWRPPLDSWRVRHLLASPTPTAAPTTRDGWGGGGGGGSAQTTP